MKSIEIKFKGGDGQRIRTVEQVPDKTSDLINDSGFLTASENISQTISSASTSEDIPSAKAVYDYINSLNATEVSY